MFRPSRPQLKRPRTPYVVKYLEGIPKPTTLLDHLAGADLVSGGNRNAPFFSTVPRYLDCKHENRLSKLFFHHCLYPAGGARLPTQAVVIRGGRSVVPCRPRAHYDTEAPVLSDATADRGTASTAAAPVAAARAPVDPLAVPASQLGASNAHTAPMLSPTDARVFSHEQTHLNSSHWSRSDPARPTYFYAPHTSRDAESHYGFQFQSGQPRVVTAPPLRYERAFMEGGALVREGQAGEGRTVALRRPRRRSSFSSLMPDASPPQATEDVNSKGVTASNKTPRTPLGGWEAQKESGSREDMHESEPLSSSTATHLPPLRSEHERHLTQRTVSDVALAPLRGVVESHFLPKAPPTDVTSLTTHALQEVASLAVNASVGLLRPGLSEDTSPSPSLAFLPIQHEGTVKDVVGDACLRNARATAGSPFVAYFQTHVPRTATVSLPLDDHVTEPGREMRLSRLAGGLEPLVPFAVGTPLVAPRDPFFHVTCLLRVEGRRRGSSMEGATSAGVRDGDEEERDNRHSSDAGATNDSRGEKEDNVAADSSTKRHAGVTRRPSPAALEPWRLGGPALDPTIKYAARTVSETSGPTSSSSLPELLVGRADCESYLLPQHELLLTLHVPPTTTRLCEEQNQSRLAKQAKLGHASSPAPVAWATDEKTHLSSSVLKGKGATVGEAWAGMPSRSFLSPSVASTKQNHADTTAAASETDWADAFGFMSEPASNGEDRGSSGVRTGDGQLDDKDNARNSRDDDDYVAPSEDRRLTADRLLARNLRNAEEAMRTGVPGQPHRPSGSVSPAPSASTRRDESVLRYEVRALPGDVVYIPQGWAYTVKRVVGTALIDLASATTTPSSSPSSSTGLSREVGSPVAPRAHVFSNRTVSFTSGIAPPRAVPRQGSVAKRTASTSDPSARKTDNGGTMVDKTSTADDLDITSVAVDAFVLNYKPYPLLSKEQAAVYISANYAHGGIEEFYEKGGNPRFYKYE